MSSKRIVTGISPGFVSRCVDKVPRKISGCIFLICLEGANNYGKGPAKIKKAELKPAFLWTQKMIYLSTKIKSLPGALSPNSPKRG